MLRCAVTVRSTDNALVQFVAVGSYQLNEAIRAHARLAQKGFASKVTAIIEPGRLREPRDDLEAHFVLSDREVEALFPPDLPRILVTHTRSEPMIGILRRLDGGRTRFRALGYRNRGGTLDANGMLFASKCAWAHLVQEAATLLGRKREDVLNEAECAALDGNGDPKTLFQ